MKKEFEIIGSKIISKLIACMLIIALTSANFLVCGNYFVSYAKDLADEQKGGVLDQQTEATIHKNVKFDAYFEGENGNTHYKVADVNEDEVNIDLSLQVQKAGYLKNAVISLKANDEEKLNYELKNIKDDEARVEKQDENTISLKQVNKDEIVQLRLNISPKIGEEISTKTLNQNNKVCIKGTYIDDKGNENQIEKDVTLNIGWTGKSEIQNKVEVVKYIPLNINDTRKVLVQFNVKSGLVEKENQLAIKDTTIVMNIPEFNTVKPEKIEVSAKSTKATNGLEAEEVSFNKENWSKDDKEQTLTIKTENKVKDEIIKVGRGEDEYLVTFIYPQEAYDSIKEKEIKLDTKLNTKINVYSNEAQEELTKDFEETVKLKEPIGKLLSFEGISKTESIGKGKMYANINSVEKDNETEYETSWNINVGFKDSLEGIILQDSSEKIASMYGQVVDISKYTKYISTKVNKESFLSILGEKGKITIRDIAGNIVNTISSTTKIDENGDYIVNYYGEVSKIQIETSKPIQEGNLIINNTKVINGKLPAGKTEIENYANLAITYGLWQKEIDSDKYLQTEEKQVIIPFEETSSKARLTINKERLSTLVKNENVEFKIELGNNTDTSDLYVDPMFDIELPSYIEDIDIKEHTILYDNELIIKDVQKFQNANGNIVIRVQLAGVQTKFSTGTITNGTNIILKTDIKVNLLTPDKEDEIKMYYYNMNTKNYEELIETENGMAGLSKVAISYAAPIGMLSVSNWSHFDETERQVMSVNQGPMVEQINVYQPTKLTKMNLILVNNTGSMCDGISVLGRIPYAGNKSILTGEELGTTVDTTLRGLIEANGIDEDKIKVYYSENGEATKDLNNKNNGWTDTIVDETKIRSFLIIVNDYQMQAGELVGFSYYIELPSDMTYNNNIYSTYATYYTENSEEASYKQETEADLVGLTTGRGPELAIEQEVIGANEDGTVNENRLLKFKVKVSNNGTETAKDVVIKDELPKWTTYVRSYYEGNTSVINTESYLSTETNSLETMREWNVIENGDTYTNKTPILGWNVSEIQPGETVEKEFEIITQGKPGKYEYYKDYPGLTYGEDGKLYITTQVYDVNTDSVQEKNTELSQVPEIDITNITTVTASNFATELKASTNPVTVKESKLDVEEILNSVLEDGTVQQGEEISLSMSISNIKSEDENDDGKVNNVHIEKEIPEGLNYENVTIEIINILTGETVQKNIEKKYDKANRKFSLDVQSLEAGEVINAIMKMSVDNLKEGVFEKEINTDTVITADGCDSIHTNKINFIIKKPQIKVTTNCNTPNEYLSEGEIVEYSVVVENIGSLLVTGLTIKQSIPEEIEVLEASRIMFGEEKEVSMNSLRQVITYGSLEPGGVATLNIKAKVLAVNKDTSIINIIQVLADNTDFIIDTIDQVIEKSANASNGNNNDNHGNNSGNSGSSTGKNNRISGIAWLDGNENGKRDNGEELLNGITVMAINTEDGTIGKTVDEKEAITTTTGGNYLLSNLKDGNYIIAFLYDTVVYTVTKYQSTEAGKLLDSDAIEREITQNGETKLAGVTDTINLSRSISNIDLGLVTKEKFDLKLEKTVVKVSVQNKEGVKVHDYNNVSLAQVPITGKELKNSTIVAEYKITVTNEGNIAGYAKNIVDYLPKELSFNSELNSNWYKGNDNYLYNTSLAEQIINPGESKEISLVLTKKLSEESTGIINNNAEIKESYNENGLKDKDSTAGNKIQDEDDQNSADIIITVRTGGAITYIGIAILILVIVANIIYIVRKKQMRR